MDEPLVVPGHPVDNPPTDDFWPHLSDRLEPVFSEDDGDPAGPIPTLGIRWTTGSPAPARFATLPHMADALVALTDSRIVAAGRVGVDSPPDRRLVTQFRLVWCAAVSWNFADPGTPASLTLHGMSRSPQPLERALTITLRPGTDARGLAQELLRRVARNYLRLDLVDPEASVSRDQTEMDYLRELAGSVIDPAEPVATVPFPRFRWIEHGRDLRIGGPGVRAEMVHAQFSSV